MPKDTKRLGIYFIRLTRYVILVQKKSRKRNFIFREVVEVVEGTGFSNEGLFVRAESHQKYYFCNCHNTV